MFTVGRLSGLAIAALALVGCRSEPGQERGSAVAESTATLQPVTTLDDPGASHPSGEFGDGLLSVGWFDLGSDVGFVLRSQLSPVLRFDVNGNGKSDDDIDVTYAVDVDSGQPCVRYISTGACGAWASEARVAVRQRSPYEVHWRIPKKEISRDPSRARVGFAGFNVETQAVRYWPSESAGSFVLLEYPGAAVASPPPADWPATQRRPSQPSSSRTPAAPPRTEGPAAARTPAVPKPSIALFVAEPDVVNAGEPATLRWEVLNASKTRIPGVGDFDDSGSIAVRPVQSTNYVLIAENADGLAESRSLRVNVTVPVEILSFVAQPRETFLGDTVRLEWSTRGTKDVLLELVSVPGTSIARLKTVQPAAGGYNLVIDPGQFTVYGTYELRLLATGPAGAREARARIEVKRR